MMLEKAGVKIWRPRQLYVGETERDYVEIEERAEAKVTDRTKEPTQVSYPPLFFVGEGRGWINKGWGH